MRRVFVLAVLALLVISPAAFGQAQRGTIEVTVTDAEGRTELAEERARTHRGVRGLGRGPLEHDRARVAQRGP